MQYFLLLISMNKTILEIEKFFINIFCMQNILSFATLKVSQFSIPQKICFKLMARQLDKDSRDVKNIFLALKMSEFWGLKDAASSSAYYSCAGHHPQQPSSNSRRLHRA